MEGFLGAYKSGQGMASNQFEVMKAMKMRDLSKQYQLGAPEEKQGILGQIAGFDPQQAQFLQNQQVAQQAQQQKKLERLGKFAGGVKSSLAKADPKQKNSVYKAYLDLAQQSGMDTSDAPEEYSEEVEQYIDTVIGMTGGQKDQIAYGKVPEGSYLDKTTGQLKQMEGYQKSDDDRKIIKDISGRQRFADSGELVFPNIKQTASPEQQAKKEKVLFDKATTLRKEFTANSKDFVKVRDAHNRVKAAAQDPSAAGDLALVFNYMKVLDPGSVVRESEFATASNSAGVPDRIRNIYNKALEGTRLAPKQREDFVDRSDKLFNAQLGSQKRLVNKFGTIADRAGVDKQDVLLEFANDTPEATETVKEVEGQKQLSEMTIEELQALRQQAGG